MKSFLCDTNIISELMRRKPHPKVRQWSRSIAEFSISVITVDEISFWLNQKKLLERIHWLEGFIDDECNVISVDHAVASRAGQIRGQLASKGIFRSQPDMLIAATAWVHDLTLATRNTRDFEGTGIALFNPFEG
jgi:predicted nucleic acid-binding protein